MKFSDEDLAKLSADELRTLLANLRNAVATQRVSKAEADNTAERIRTLLSKRPAKGRNRRAAGAATLERRVAEALGRVAEQLGRRYDLSAETAKRLSVGTKNFKAHQLTDKNGLAKTGGSMKGGRMSIDRYISYRVRDSTVSLAFLLFPGQPEDAGKYVVIATDDLMTAGDPLDTLVPEKSNEYGWSPAFRERMRAVPFESLDDAARRYEDLIAKVAPRLEVA